MTIPEAMRVARRTPVHRQLLLTALLASMSTYAQGADKIWGEAFFSSESVSTTWGIMLAGGAVVSGAAAVPFIQADNAAMGAVMIGVAVGFATVSAWAFEAASEHRKRERAHSLFELRDGNLLFGDMLALSWTGKGDKVECDLVSARW